MTSFARVAQNHALTLTLFVLCHQSEKVRACGGDETCGSGGGKSADGVQQEPAPEICRRFGHHHGPRRNAVTLSSPPPKEPRSTSEIFLSLIFPHLRW
jgi:hypothetical protein